MNAAVPLETMVTRLFISAKDRSRMYETLCMLLDNNVLLGSALDKMYAVYSNYGAKPKNSRAQMLYEVKEIVRDGESLSYALQGWVSNEEAEIIRAGEDTGKLREACRSAIDLLAKTTAIRSAIFKGSAYPLVLFGVLGYLLYIIATKLAPAISSVAPISSWTGAASVMFAVAGYLTRFGILTVVALVGGAVAIGASFPRLRGNLRFHLDKIPPWSIYRTIKGALFLKNYAVMVKNGIGSKSSLEKIHENSTPYMRERVAAVLRGIEGGLNLGVALEDAEYDFPDQEAIHYVKLLAGLDGFEDSLANYADEWLKEATEKVQRIMNYFFFAAILSIGLSVGMIITASTQIEAAVSSTHH